MYLTLESRGKGSNLSLRRNQLRIGHRIGRCKEVEASLDHTLYIRTQYIHVYLFLVFRYHPDNIPRTFNDYREQKHGNVFKEEEYCCYMFGIGVMTYLSLFMSVQSFCTIFLFRISGLCLPRTCVCLVILCACIVQRVLVSSLRGNYHRIHEIFSFKLTRDILIEAESRRKNQRPIPSIIASIEIFFDQSDRTRYCPDVFVDEIDLDAEFASPSVFNNVLSQAAEKIDTFTNEDGGEVADPCFSFLLEFPTTSATDADAGAFFKSIMKLKLKRSSKILV